jgi:hypothetical protein
MHEKSYNKCFLYQTIFFKTRVRKGPWTLRRREKRRGRK